VLADIDGQGAGAFAELAVISEHCMLSIISTTGMAVAGHAVVVPGDRVGSPAAGNMSGGQLRLLSGGMEGVHWQRRPAALAHSTWDVREGCVCKY
jgi:hypothetical protein